MLRTQTAQSRASQTYASQANVASHAHRQIHGHAHAGIPARTDSSKPSSHFRRSTLALAVIASLNMSIGMDAKLIGNAEAAVISITGACTLARAITNANNDAATIATCPAGSGHDTLALQNTVSLYSSNNSLEGENGLPIIVSPITIEGNDHSIRRAPWSLAGGFRIIHIRANGSLTLKNTTVSGGNANAGGLGNNGGGIFVRNGGGLRLENSAVTGNFSTASGAGILINTEEEVFIIDSLISNNTATGATADGGGIDSSAPLTISNSVIRNNFSGGSGGGVYSSSYPLSINQTTINNNSAAGNASSDGGGGLVVGTISAANIRNSTISGNSSAGKGGGLYIRHENDIEDLPISNVTVSGNSAAEGGGLFIYGRRVALNNSTISNNLAPANAGAGVHVDKKPYYNTSLTLRNSIISNSGVGKDCAIDVSAPHAAVLINAGANWFEDSSCIGTGLGDPIIEALADNGGPTQTHALPANSWVTGLGNIGFCLAAPVSGKDQRGTTRGVGGRCDIGAYEVTREDSNFFVIPLADGRTVVFSL